MGAEEYYEKTKDMGAAAADLRYQDMLDAGVGIEAPDDYTLVFTCKHSCPYFDTVASYTSFYPPLSADRRAGHRDLPWLRQHQHVYCGPYIVEEYIQATPRAISPTPTTTMLPTSAASSV